MIKIRLINYFDVWGNEEDGWQVNNLCVEWDRYVPDLEDETLLQLLIDEGFLRRDVRQDQIEFVFVGPEMVEIEQTEDGFPLGRFEVLEYDTNAKISLDRDREVESMREELSQVIANTAPAEAWEAWVGEQSPAEFVTVGISEGLRNIRYMASQYARDLPVMWPDELGDANPEQLEQIAVLLVQYIDEELQYDPDGQADDLLEQFDMDTIANYMDDNIRETLHNHLAPCTELEFVRAYLDLHRAKFGSEFEIS